MVFKRFLLTLMSSWIVNPLGIAIAHAFGFSNLPTVLLILIGTGACAPFQLFLNECLAAGVQKGHLKTNHQQMALIVTIQSISYGASTLWLSEIAFRIHEIILLGIFLCASNVISYSLTKKYYHLVMKGAISNRKAIIIGGLPGLIALKIHLGYGLLFCWHHATPSETLLLVCILPAIAQWHYVNQIAKRFDLHEAGLRRVIVATPSVATGALLTALVTLGLLTMAGSFLREKIATHSVNHVALILVGLNSLVSLGNTVTRSAFLSQPTQAHSRTLIIASIATFLMAAAFWHKFPLTGLFAALIASQLGIVAAVDHGRRIRTVPARQTH
jgi:hypothetical protein